MAEGHDLRQERVREALALRVCIVASHLSKKLQKGEKKIRELIEEEAMEKVRKRSTEKQSKKGEFSRWQLLPNASFFSLHGEKNLGLVLTFPN